MFVLLIINIICIFADNVNLIITDMNRERIFSEAYKDADGHFHLGKEINKFHTLPIKLTDSRARIPDYAYDGESVGLDLYAVSVEYIPEKDCFCYDTGVAVQLEDDEVGFIVPNSRNRNTEYYVPNTPGVVDPGYTNSIKVNYKNRVPRYISRLLNAFEDVFNKLGLLDFADKLSELNKAMQLPYNVEFDENGKAKTCIGQLVICKVRRKKLVVVDELAISKRMLNGHGSTIK